MRDAQLLDPKLKNIINSFDENYENLIRWTKRGYLFSNGVLYCYSDSDIEGQIVIPHHDDSTAGHYGINRTISRITKPIFLAWYEKGDLKIC